MQRIVNIIFLVDKIYIGYLINYIFLYFIFRDINCFNIFNELGFELFDVNKLRIKISYLFLIVYIK